MQEFSKLSTPGNQSYTYQDTDDEIDRWNQLFTSRIGDGTGDPEEQYLSLVKQITACRSNARCLDIGSGFGRIINIIKLGAASIVGLEPDFQRFNACYNALNDGKRIHIINSTSLEFRNSHPDERFDIIFVSMVLQHVPTGICAQILADVSNLLRQDGIAIIAATQQEVERFTCDRNQTPMSTEEFDRYADSDAANQQWGLPVRQFSKTSFLQAIEGAGLRLCEWGQFSYVRPDKLQWYADIMKVPAQAIQDVAVSQYGVVKRSS